MKTIHFFITGCLVLLGFCQLKAQSYQQLWKEIEALEKQDLPQSLIEKAQFIYKKAESERNTPQMMKAFLCAMAQRNNVNSNYFFTDIKILEEWVAHYETTSADAAVLHSLLGEIYARTSTRGSYKQEITPSNNISEWSQYTYQQKAFTHYLMSLTNLETLDILTAKNYLPLIKIGEWSKYYDHSLMHLIARRSIYGMLNLQYSLDRFYNQSKWEYPLKDDEFMSILLVGKSVYDCPATVMQTYRRLLTQYRKANKQDAWLLTEVDRLESIHYYSQEKEVPTDSLRTILEYMKQEYSNREVCAEVYKLLASTYKYNNSSNAKKLEIVQEAITKYPHYARINELKNIEQDILSPGLRISLEGALYPDKEAKLEVSHRNLSSFTLKFHKINLPPDSLLSKEHWGYEWLTQHCTSGLQQTINLKPHKEYFLTDTLLTIKAPPSGVYLMEALANKELSNLCLLYVTPLRLIRFKVPGDSLQLTVLDGISGHPVPFADVYIAKHKSSRSPLQQKKFKTNKQGTVTIKVKPKWMNYRAATEQENSMLYDEHGYRYSQVNNKKEKEKAYLFTDRAIYRPGQTMHIKGLIYKQLIDETNVVSNKEFSLSLEDANRKEISRIQVKTNEYGSFAADFVVPIPCLTGRFTIRLNNEDHITYKEIRIEEYKRPTFEVTFSPVTKVYSIGDSVILKGEARTYSGAPLAQSKVAYRIDWQAQKTLTRWGKFSNNREIISGETQTDENGIFHIPVYIKSQEDLINCFWWYFSYYVVAHVTASTGETQSTNTQLRLSNIPLKLGIENSQDNVYMVKESPQPLTIKATNLNYEPIATNISYKIHKLSSLKSFYAISTSNKEQIVGEVVLEGHTVSNKAFIPEELYKLPSGNYRLTITAGLPEYNDKAESYHDFVLFSVNDKRVPNKEINWFYQPNDYFNSNQPSMIQFGTCESNVYVLYDVFTKDRIIDSRRFVLSDSVVTFNYNYLPEYGKGIYISVFFIKDGKVYSTQSHINKAIPEKDLSFKWETFRDKLHPGQQEEWRLRVLTPEGKPANAEVLATMYDASLDQFSSANKWILDIYYSRLRRTRPYLEHWSQLYNSTFAYIHFPVKQEKTPNTTFDDFYPLLTHAGLYYYREEKKNSSKEKQRPSIEIERESVMNTFDRSEFETTGKPIKPREEEIFCAYTEEQALLHLGKAKPRENFNETAFFLPQLCTDSLGQVSIAFTLPESLTRWHFMALAHTPTMENGLLEDFVTASKEFMVQPNLPRFIRAGDTSTISTALINLSETDIKGTARLELFNPATEKILVTRKQSFAVAAGKTEAIEFSFTVKDASIPLLACRIVADCGTYSDGEQRYLPVLTDKIWMTEALSLFVNGAKTVQKPLDKLFNNNSRTTTEHRMTIEFTGNPAWLAIQALPSIATPTNENALSWAAAYYANTLATHIMQSQPRIKAIFDTWRIQGTNKENLWNNLQKNEELKSILLEETPWLADANNEAEQKERLAVLFDLTASEGKAALYLSKLKELQNEEGAWAWYKGMHSSRYITTYILLILEHLSALTGELAQEDAGKIEEKATVYLNKQLIEEHKNMLRAEKEGNKQVRPSEMTIQYLYALAINKRSITKEMRPTINYMINKLPDLSTDFTIHGKALAAIILKRTNRTEQAEAFIKSLLEYTVYTPELGRYFDTQAAYYSWRDYRIPTQVAVMEALTYVTPENTSTLEEMKQWLLKQKQAQSWDTPVNTVDAVYALLMQGTDLLTEKKPVQLLLDKRPVTSAEAPIPGMDYIKRTYTGEDLKTFPKQITVKKEDAGIAWGAVYAQYLEDMEKTSSSKRLAESNSELHAQPISVERRVLIERIVDGKAVWEPATEATEWKVGDKIMSRLVITCDRDMDFVQLKDTRAACTEPIDVLSSYRYDGNVGYYMSIKDASTSFFFDRLRKGVYTIDNVMRIDRKGTYQMGIATMQSAYAPEFTANTTSSKVVVK